MSLEAGEAGANTLGPPHVSVRCLTLFYEIYIAGAFCISYWIQSLQQHKRVNSNNYRSKAPCC